MQKYFPIIDNGHGKLTKGKRSHILSDGRQLLEWEFNLDVVVRLTDILHDEGIHYGLSNLHPELKDNWLEGRTNKANELVNIAKAAGVKPYFISIHANAGPVNRGGWTSANGIETWHYKGSETGKHLAEVFQRHLVNETGLRDRGLKFTDDKRKAFYVLKKTSCPAILTENGFFNNRTEVEKLLNPDFVQDVAQAHFCAIMEIEQNGW